MHAARQAVRDEIADQVGDRGVLRQVERRQRTALVTVPPRPARAGERRLVAGEAVAEQQQSAAVDQAHPGRAPVEPVDQAEHADDRRRVDVGARVSL